MDELDPAIGRVGQCIQDVAIKNESADHVPGLLERMVERGMVEVAQIAPKPDQGTGIFRHRAFWSL